MSDHADQKWREISARDNARQQNGHIYGGYTETNYYSYDQQSSPKAVLKAESSSKAPIFDRIKQALSSASEQKRRNEALLSAANRGQQTRMERLILEGADPDYGNKVGWTALHIACNHGYVEIVEMLITRFKAEINVCDSEEATPLDYAIRLEQLATVEVLLTHHARLHGPGWSTLGTACTTGNVAIARKLIEAGAPITAPFLEWRIPHQLVLESGQHDVLINSQPLHIASGLGSVELVKMLLENRAPVEALSSWQCRDNRNRVTRDGEMLTALQVTRDAQCAQELLTHGANINVQDTSGSTPIMRAVKTLNPDLVDVLMENGADCGIKNKHGDAVYTMAELMYGRMRRANRIAR